MFWRSSGEGLARRRRAVRARPAVRRVGIGEPLLDLEEDRSGVGAGGAQGGDGALCDPTGARAGPVGAEGPGRGGGPRGPAGVDGAAGPAGPRNSTSTPSRRGARDLPTRASSHFSPGILSVLTYSNKMACISRGGSRLILIIFIFVIQVDPAVCFSPRCYSIICAAKNAVFNSSERRKN